MRVRTSQHVQPTRACRVRPLRTSAPGAAWNSHHPLLSSSPTNAAARHSATPPSAEAVAATAAASVGRGGGELRRRGRARPAPPLLPAMQPVRPLKPPLRSSAAQLPWWRRRRRRLQCSLACPSGLTWAVVALPFPSGPQLPRHARVRRGQAQLPPPAAGPQQAAPEDRRCWPRQRRTRQDSLVPVLP
eukprot:SM000002S05716  [mRNA]  locus=s2:1708710:1709832:- [translate_table: standard]